MCERARVYVLFGLSGNNDQEEKTTVLRPHSQDGASSYSAGLQI